MAKQPNVNFSDPLPLYRANATVTNDSGDVLTVMITGPENMLKVYLQNARLYVALIDPDAVQSAPQIELPRQTQWISSEGRQPLPNEPVGREGEPAVASTSSPQAFDPMKDLEIRIGIRYTTRRSYALQLNVDPPTVEQDHSHWYVIDAPAQKADESILMEFGTTQVTLWKSLWGHPVIPTPSQVKNVKNPRAWDQVNESNDLAIGWWLQIYGVSAATYDVWGHFIFRS